MSALPEAELEQIRQWCSDQWAEELTEQVRCESHVGNDRVVLCETRAPRDGQGEWTHEEFAGLTFRPTTRDWSLHWVDADSRWHDYEPEGSQVVGTCAMLLAEIDRDPVNIFKG